MHKYAAAEEYSIDYLIDFPFMIYQANAAV